MREPETKSQPRARELRGKMPAAELILWSQLRRSGIGIRFRRQHPIGPYITDFAAPLAKLVVELDGFSHWSEKAQRYDKVRDAYIRSRGWQVLRFGNEDVFKRLRDVLRTIEGCSPPPDRPRKSGDDPPPP